MKVRTLDLREGDVITFADLSDKVLGVVPMGGGVIRVDTLRRLPGDETHRRYVHFFAGVDAFHDVTERGAG